jgi:hypothetical protein
MRKFRNKFVGENIENMLLDGEDQGYSFIEVRSKIYGKSEEMICGPQELKLVKRRVAGQQFATNISAQIVEDGIVKFFPDKDMRLWGYVLDTPKNRIWLASTLSGNDVTIADVSVKNEIIKLAMEKGMPTERTRADKSLDNYLSKEKTETKNENEALKAELAQLKAEKMEADKKKPLDGKKVTVKKTAAKKATTTTKK